MANNNYQPSEEYLRSLNFVETNGGGFHPYEIEDSLSLGQNVFLRCNAFFDFYIEIDGHDIDLKFSSNDELECFIRIFKNTES